MSAAAQLDRHTWNSYDAYDISVFLAEQVHGAPCDRVGVSLLLCRDSNGREHFAVHDVLDFVNLRRRHGSVMREIEAQSVGRNERSGLVHMLAQDGSKRRVEKVSRGVIALSVEAWPARNHRIRTTDVNISSRLAGYRNLSVDFANLVHVHCPVVACDGATIGNLSARLRVEGSITKHHGDPSIREGAKRSDYSIHLGSVVSDELNIVARQPGIIAEIVATSADLFRFTLLL